MEYRRYLRSIIFLSVLSISFGQALLAQQKTISKSMLDGLPFEAISGKDHLYEAKDTAGNRWIRGHVPRDLLGKTVVFQIPSAHVQYYELYLPQENGLRLLHRNTDTEDMHFKSRFPQYKFVPRDSVFYLRLQQDFGLSLPVTIQERNEFSAHESSRLLRIGLYYGLALMSLVFNIVFYLIFRDKRFIAYCTLLLGTFLSFFYEDGMFYYLMEGQWIMNSFIVWNTSFTAMACVAFTYYFLGLERVLRPYVLWYWVASAVLLGVALLYTWTDRPIFNYLSGALCFSFAFFGLYLAIRRFKKDVYARFLTISCGLVALAGLGYILYNRTGSPSLDILDISMFRLFSALEVISISFAIIYKVRGLQRENERYREELNSYIHQLEKGRGNDYVSEQNRNTRTSTQTDIHTILQELKEKCNLTDREMEVLLCIQERLSNQEIADKLCISLSTTKYHVGNLYFKLDVKNRREVQQVLQQL